MCIPSTGKRLTKFCRALRGKWLAQGKAGSIYFLQTVFRPGWKLIEISFIHEGTRIAAVGMVVPLSPRFLARCIEFQFFGQDRHSLGAILNAHRNTKLQHGHDLFGSCSRLERSLDMPAGTGCIHVRDRGIEGDADQLHKPWCEKAALATARACSPALSLPALNWRWDQNPRRCPTAVALGGNVA